MRIYCAVRHANNPDLYYGGLWSGNFYPALINLGHEIIESKIDLLPASHFMHIPGNFTPQEKEIRATITQQIIEEVQAIHQQQPIDIFLSYFYNAHFDAEGFAEIHRLGIPTVNFYCNSIYQFELVSEIAAKVNFAWHPEKLARSLYLQVGANPIWVQMGANPHIYYPMPQIKRQAKACFVGQRYADRDRFLHQLISNKVPIDIYGSGWGFTNSNNTNRNISESKPDLYLGRRSHKPGGINSYIQAAWDNIKNQGIITGVQRTIRQLQYRQQSRQIAPIIATAACGFADNISSTFAAYEVILNFSNVWADGRPGSQLIPHVRLRDFEAPMCRTCYLTGYTEEIAEFYELGTEIDTYQNPDELAEKTKFYLYHPTEAEKLREAGYQRALKDHTWQKRFVELFQQIF